MSENPQGGSREDLEQRWGVEHSPQLTLQLAEEYRKGGDLSRAVNVLIEGLAHHPAHVAARVALGRLLLEDGRATGAAEALESVVADDPTHLVANKLLVTAALALGDHDKAKDRLALYRVLNASDPEVEVLESRIAEAESKGRAEATAHTAGDHEPDVEVAAIEVGGDDPVTEQTADRPPSGEPFGELWSGLDAAAYRKALAAEGLFFQTTVEPPAEEELEAPAETVTLGRLYLDQGHSQEAERIFRAVLAREPDNEGALAGLAEALGEPAELTAADLVAADLLAGADPIERKRLVVEGYRNRLRGASSSRS